LLSFIQQVRRSTFLRHNIIFFIGSVAVGALNYLYYPVLGRLLEPASFGEVQTLISLFLQIAIFLSVLGLVTINIVANYRSPERRNAVVLEFEQLAFVISIVALFFTIIFQDTLKHFLQFEDSLPFILLMIALVATVPYTFRGAYLRGRQRFGLASAGNISSAGGKLVCSALFVLVGWGTAGAIGGLVAAQIVACILTALWARSHGLNRPSGTKLIRLPNMRILAPELRFGLLVLVGSLVVTLQYSVDVIIIKHYFDPHTAGLYAAVASVARIIFFLTASVALVLMPLVKIQAPAEANRRLLLKSLLLLVITGVPVTILFMIAPAWTIGLLMGGEYASLAYLLPPLSVAIFIVAVLNLIVSYYLALRRYAVAPIIIIGAAVTYGAMLANHGSLRAIINSLLGGSLVMLIALVAWMGGTRLRRILHERNVGLNHHSGT
jgi:O-antigen/teichoic acid export membrane protein